MELFKRILFTLRMLHRYRHALAKIDSTTPRQTYQISPTNLKHNGIKVLVLDFDGVLAAHGEALPNQELQPWLHDCVNTYGSTQVFVLSNKPLQSRINYFNQLKIRCIAGVKKKPYPDGLQKIIALTGQSPETVMLVDDRLLTGCLAACIAGNSVTLITRPYVSLSKRPIQELFFMTLRFLERYIVQWIARF
ncbi:MAG: HAD family hydrolase [Thiomargarita sp.]|nr:HAD family hydrolase [Thiomargarita sp.]